MDIFWNHTIYQKSLFSRHPCNWPASSTGTALHHGITEVRVVVSFRPEFFRSFNHFCLSSITKYANKSTIDQFEWKINENTDTNVSQNLGENLRQLSSLAVQW